MSGPHIPYQTKMLAAGGHRVALDYALLFCYTIFA
jgi:hypothetical protein